MEKESFKLFKVIAKENAKRAIEKLSENINDMTKYQNKRGEEILSIFARNGYEKLTKELLQNHSHLININSQNKNGQTALHIASQLGRSKIVKLLVESPNIDLNIIDKNERTALNVAAASFRYKAIEILLGKNSLIKPDKNNETPIHFLASKSPVNLFTKLLEKNECKENLEGFNQKKSTPLHCSIHSLNFDKIKILIDLRVNLNSFDQNRLGISPLQLLCKKLKEFKKKIKNGNSKLKSAEDELIFEQKIDEMIVLLIEKGADVNSFSSPISTSTSYPRSYSRSSSPPSPSPYFTLLVLEKFEILDHIINTLKIELSNQINQNGDLVTNCLHLLPSTSLNYIEEKKLFSFNQQNSQTGQTPLHSLISSFKYEKRQIEMIDHLLKSNPDLVHIPDKKGLFPFHYLSNFNFNCYFNSEEEMGNLLIHFGANINQKDSINGNTLLHFFLINSKLEKLTLEFFLKKGGNVNLRNNFGHSVGYLLAKEFKESRGSVFGMPLDTGGRKKENFIYYIGKNIFNFNLPSHLNCHFSIQSYLFFLSKSPHQIYDIDHNNNNNPNNNTNNNNNNNTNKGEEEGEGEGEEGEGERGYYPIHEIMKSGERDVFYLLIKHGAKVNVKTPKGKSLLHFSSSICDYHISKYLLEEFPQYIKVNARSNDLRTPLHYFFKNWLKFDPDQSYLLLKYLIVDQRAEINEVDEKGNTPILYSCLHLKKVFSSSFSRRRSILTNGITHGGDRDRDYDNDNDNDNDDCVIRIWKFMIEHGADHRLANYNGDLPIDYLEEENSYRNFFLSLSPP